MILEIGLLSMCLLAAGLVADLFFCEVESAPGVARKTAESARFAGLREKAKLVRFW